MTALGALLDRVGELVRHGTRDSNGLGLSVGLVWELAGLLEAAREEQGRPGLLDGSAPCQAPAIEDLVGEILQLTGAPDRSLHINAEQVTRLRGKALLAEGSLILAGMDRAARERR